MSDEIKLKPCPFCGGPASHNEGGNSVYGRFWWVVGCASCGISFADRERWTHDRGAKLDPDYPPKECFDRWNTRTDTLPTWQPIETAPRDGARILAVCHYYMGVTARAATVDDPKVIWIIYYDHGLWQTNTFGHPLPTHWMPLPTPPKGDTHD